MEREKFLPVTAVDVRARGWDGVDFVYVTGDAYVDHPSFGVSIISRVLEAEGFRVAILSQPDYKSCEDFRRFGRPRLGFLVSAGNIDSMVAHYTVAKRRRTSDYYSPGGKMGRRPDRAVIVYCNRIREAYGDVPIILGGLEASLRRFAHYDYWDNRVRRSILVDSRADILTYGMGENILRRLARLLDRGIPIKKIRDVRGCVYLAPRGEKIHYDYVECGDFNEIKQGGEAYARAFREQYRNQDAITGKAVVEYYDDKMLVQNPPMPPLSPEELDEVYALPYARTYHPDYEAEGGVPAIEEVKFSIAHNRGCFGSCNFCAITFHQGRAVRARNEGSVLREAELIAADPDFKGYIHDVGGPTANFRAPACKKQLEKGVCLDRKCLFPTPCKNLTVDHTAYAAMLRKIEKIPRVKRVFIRSGIRYDYLMADKNREFLHQLVTHHVSGQLKVAPEHCAGAVLDAMGKPRIGVYEAFKREYFRLSAEAGMEQYLVPYLMSSHPGSTLKEAVELALWLKKEGYMPEQVQDFYPTPGTVSTVMYATGIDPLSGKRVYVAKDYREKQLQRALLQYARPQNADLVREALRLCNREDLIGFGPGCLVRPARGSQGQKAPTRVSRGGKKTSKNTGVQYNGARRKPAMEKSASHVKKDPQKPTARRGKK
ncbi:MAG: YgiQ family radical SAM protein [Clostridia bacterium]|nr:YgiQ family radical SAM protein [Clostridia bacterium]